MVEGAIGLDELDAEFGGGEMLGDGVFEGVDVADEFGEGEDPLVGRGVFDAGGGVDTELLQLGDEVVVQGDEGIDIVDLVGNGREAGGRQRRRGRGVCCCCRNKACWISRRQW